MPNTMDRDEVYRTLTPIFHELFEDPSIQLSDTLTAKEVAQWDSLNHINLIITVEQKFGIKFTTAEVARLQNVGQFTDAILQKVNRASLPRNVV
jgi:acyl carrier protein